MIGLTVTAVSANSCGLLDSFRLEIKEYTCESPEVPVAFDGMRVVFVTDIHRGPFRSQDSVGRLVDRINGLDGDLILLGGDYVYGGPKHEASCFAELTRLRAPLGRYAVLGNHDYGTRDSPDSGPAKAIDAAARVGIPLLRNQAVWLEKDGQRIRLGGVEDYSAATPRLAPIVDGTAPGDFVLLLSHNPDYSEELPPGIVDLVLSGHTHGGQVSLFGPWAPVVNSEHGQKYRTGVVENGVTTVIVSNGIGTSTLVPLRLYAPPQVVLLTLRHGPSASVHP